MMDRICKMKNMRFEVHLAIENAEEYERKNTSSLFVIKSNNHCLTEKEFLSLNLFFVLIYLHDVPRFLVDSKKRIAFNTSDQAFYKGPSYPDDDDEDPIILTENQVIVGGTSDVFPVISLKEFESLVMQCAYKALEAVKKYELLKRNRVDKKWINSIEEWIKENDNFRIQCLWRLFLLKFNLRIF